MMAILINKMLRKKDIAQQHATLDNEIYAKLQCSAKGSKDKDLIGNFLFDVVSSRLLHRATLEQIRPDHSR